jgi:ornithine carbamoyltransferase
MTQIYSDMEKNYILRKKESKKALEINESSLHSCNKKWILLFSKTSLYTRALDTSIR